MIVRLCCIGQEDEARECGSFDSGLSVHSLLKGQSRIHKVRRIS
jgi:hypothetical protein